MFKPSTFVTLLFRTLSSEPSRLTPFYLFKDLGENNTGQKISAQTLS